MVSDESESFMGENFAFSVVEVARRASVGRTAVFSEIRAGRLIARKLGRRTIILASDMQRWLHALPENIGRKPNP